MSKILIAVDGSKSSAKAIEYVVNRKRRGENIEVYFLNVQPKISPRRGLISHSMIEDYQKQEREAVFNQAGVKSKAKYLKADIYGEIGDAAECIIAFARKSKCDEIVMGSRGLGKVKGLLMGSVVSKVVQLSPVPVVVVR